MHVFQGRHLLVLDGNDYKGLLEMALFGYKFRSDALPASTHEWMEQYSAVQLL